MRLLWGDVGRYGLLLLGTGTMLFALGGRWDVPVAAWVFPVLLLRFTRTCRVWAGALWVWLAHVGAAVFWAQESRVGVDIGVLLGVALGAVQTAPYLADRMLAERLPSLAGSLVFPAGFAAAEFGIASWSPVSAAYGTLASTQHANLPLLQIVSITGLYGVGFLIAWFASAVNEVWQRRAWRGGVVYAAVVLAVVGGGGVRLAFAPPASATVRIAGVSPGTAVTHAQQAVFRSIPGGRKGIATAPDSEIRPITTAVQNDLLAATGREAAAGAKIVVWPEEAVPTQDANEPAVIEAARGQARRSGVYVEVGIGVYSAVAPGYGRDEAVLIDPAGVVRWVYRKAHPITGSEKYEPGDGRVPLADTPFGRLANVICHDANFPAMMRVRADIMLVPAHDWYEYGSAHTDKVSLRAVEGGYSLVRQDSAGMATTVDYEGRVLAGTDYFGTDRQDMVAYVPIRGVTTIYDRVGDVFAWTCLAILVLLGAVAALSGRRSGGSA